MLAGAHGRGAGRAARRGGRGRPQRFKRATQEPRRRAVHYCVSGRRRTADLYFAGTAKAGLVLVPGIARAGKDDPRLVAFAKTLARARFAVLVPDIANLRALRVRPGDVREIAGAVRYLAGRIAGDGQAEIGLAAISYAAGPAILAALEADTRERVRFVLAVGGYHDIEAVVRFFTTGYFRERPDGPWIYRRPNAYGKWVFVKGNTDRLKDPVDRAALTEMAERRLENPNAGVGDLVRRLGPDGRRVLDLLVNRDPDAVPGLIERLPRALRADLAALDPSRRDLSRLRARLYLIHGSDDAIIPAAESRALHAAAPEGRSRLYVVSSLAHADIGPSGLFDSLTLWGAIYALLGERDEMTPPETARRDAPAADLTCRAGGSGV